MKRSPLPRSTKPLKRTPLKIRDYVAIGRNQAVKRKRSGSGRRVSVPRDRKYLDWLKTQVCAVTWAIFSRGERISYSYEVIIDPAHGPVNGIGSKGSDDGAIPMTRAFHEEQTLIGWPKFEKKYGIDRAAIAAEHYARFKGEMQS